MNSPGSIKKEMSKNKYFLILLYTSIIIIIFYSVL